MFGRSPLSVWALNDGFKPPAAKHRCETVESRSVKKMETKKEETKKVDRTRGGELTGEQANKWKVAIL